MAPYVLDPDVRTPISHKRKHESGTFGRRYRFPRSIRIERVAFDAAYRLHSALPVLSQVSDLVPGMKHCPIFPPFDLPIWALVMFAST